MSPATFKSVNLEFFRISGFYIKCSQSGFTGARQPNWYQNNPNQSTVHSTFNHGNSSVPICYYELNQKQRDPRPVIGLLIRQNIWHIFNKSSKLHSAAQRMFKISHVSDYSRKRLFPYMCYRLLFSFKLGTNAVYSADLFRIVLFVMIQLPHNSLLS